jgi:hemerythrin superfamily protein
MMPASETASGLHAAMSYHHARLETAGRHALSTLRLEGPVAARHPFDGFKRELDAHLEAEETWILPLYRKGKPDDCSRIRSEHTELRCMADAVKRGLAAGDTDEEPLRKLLELLLDHCRLEESDCYRWAEEAIDEKASRAVLRSIEAAELESQSREVPPSVKNVKA